MRWIFPLSFAVNLVNTVPGGEGYTHAAASVSYEAKSYRFPSSEPCSSETPHSSETPFSTHSWSYSETTPAPIYSIASATNPSAPCITTISTSSTCPHICHLDFFGTFLAYPTVIVYDPIPVFEQTINVYITEFGEGGPSSSNEATITAPEIPSEQPLTWTAFDVVLTFPTTYVAYTSIDYATVLPDLLHSACATTSAPLNFLTTWASLIYPSSVIQQPSSIPPAALIEYLDLLPTVQAQLGNQICDPVNGGIAAFVPTATVTSVTTIAGNTRITHSTSVSIESQVVTPSTTSITPLPPPSLTTTSVAIAMTNAASRSTDSEKGFLVTALAAALFVV